MKFSIITIMLNEAGTLQSTIDSVQTQRGVKLEHIIVDGGSTDRSIAIAEQYASAANYPVKIIHQRKPGLYQAINEGIEAASGEIIGILHANDRYATGMELGTVAKKFTETGCDIVYGDIQYTMPNSGKHKMLRKHTAHHFNPAKLKSGFCPPHPAIFMKRSVIERHGGYDPNFRIAGDFEIMVRLLLANNVKSAYLHRTIAYMTAGGRSSYLINRLWRNNREKLKALRNNGIRSNPLMLLKRYLYLFK